MKLKHKPAIMRVIINNLSDKEELDFIGEINRIEESIEITRMKEKEYWDNYLNKLNEIKKDLKENSNTFFDLISKEKSMWLDKINKYPVLYSTLKKELIVRKILNENKR